MVLDFFILFIILLFCFKIALFMCVVFFYLTSIRLSLRININLPTFLTKKLHRQTGIEYLIIPI